MKGKKLYLLAAAAMAAVSLFPLSACQDKDPVEQDRKTEEGGINVQPYSPVISMAIGTRISANFEGCSITITSQSGTGWLYLNQFQEETCTDWERLPVYHESQYFTQKKAASEEMPVHFVNNAYVEWLSVEPANGTLPTVEDYVVITTEKGEHITGYAVIYIYQEGVGSTPTVIADKEFPMTDGEYQDIDEEWLDNRIQSVIDEHKAMLSAEIEGATETGN